MDLPGLGALKTNRLDITGMILAIRFDEYGAKIPITSILKMYTTELETSIICLN